MHFLANAEDRPAKRFPGRPNPWSNWDWFPASEIDPYNDEILAIGPDHAPVHTSLIKAGIDRHHVFGIRDRNVQWVFAPDYLNGILNR